jgi:DNA processing protein
MPHGDGTPAASNGQQPLPGGRRHSPVAANTQTLRYWLALSRAPGVGAQTFQQLLVAFDSLQPLFDTDQQPLRSLGLAEALLSYLRSPDWQAVDSDLEWLAADGHHILCFSDADYPPLLREIPDAPPLLFVHGDTALLSTPQLAVVGSRNPSPGGQANAHDMAACLAETGLTITSGLALGIDAASHQGALDAGGRTLAVAGNGLDRVYPARHRQLAHAIAAGGALVSEFPPGTPPRAAHFPRRNRLISGLSLGTLVVEAALRSGSLITARLATEQGREVFAIPGSIHNPMTRGCHALIRQGAKLVESAHDIIEELAPLAAVTRRAAAATAGTPPKPPLDQQHADLLEQMGHDPVSIDSLVKRSRLTADSVSSMILVLELHGYITSMAGGRYMRLGKRH